MLKVFTNTFKFGFRMLRQWLVGVFVHSVTVLGLLYGGWHMLTGSSAQPAPVIAAPAFDWTGLMARLILVAAAGAALPWVLRPAIKRALQEESNLVNALLLLGLLGLDGGVIWAALGGVIEAWLFGVLALCLAVLMTWYNYAMCTCFEKEA